MVLYINGNYPHHSLHGELVTRLADMGNCITVFVPMKGKELDGKYSCNHHDVSVLYDDCLKAPDRLFFLRKIHKIVERIEQQIDLKQVSCIIAGTVYSDGFAAYLLHQKYNIPFSVAMRETDATYQMKWRPYLNGAVKRLLDQSKNVIFLSPTYKRYADRFGTNQEKFTVIPNAVNDFWFENHPDYRAIHDPVSLIYVGEISKRKNVCTTISAVAELKRKKVEAVFHVVGSGDEEDNCRVWARKLGVEKQVFFYGWQNGKEKLKEFYDQADIFVMPSYRETFGTVYVEALSQGLPLIYTKGQGIDGYFIEGDVGYGCNPKDACEIASKIVEIRDNFKYISRHCVEQAEMFKWDVVAKQYNDVICQMRVR